MATDNMEKYRLSMGAAEIDQALQKAKDLPPGGVAKDTVIDESTKESTNVPTTKAVYDFVEAEKPQSELIIELVYLGWNMNMERELPIVQSLTQEIYQKIIDECTRVDLYIQNSMGLEEKLTLPLVDSQEVQGNHYGFRGFAALKEVEYTPNSSVGISGVSLQLKFGGTISSGFLATASYIILGANLQTYEAVGLGYNDNITKVEFWKDSPLARGGGSEGGGSAGENVGLQDITSEIFWEEGVLIADADDFKAFYNPSTKEVIFDGSVFCDSAGILPYTLLGAINTENYFPARTHSFGCTVNREPHNLASVTIDLDGSILLAALLQGSLMDGDEICLTPIRYIAK